MWIHPKPPAAYPFWLKPFFWNQRRKYGSVLQPGLLWGRSPLLFAAVALLYGALDRRRSPVAPELRSLLTVRVSQLNGCRFCVDLNGMTLARRAGGTDKLLALANWRDSACFTPAERAALAYAEAMTLPEPGVTAAQREAMRSAFGDDEIVEITGLVAFQNLSSKFNAAMDVPAQGFCVLPAAQADPASGVESGVEASGVEASGVEASGVGAPGVGASGERPPGAHG
jgi:AhpD family alkylhydroperoxidase